MNQTEKLYEQHLNKDERLWNELGENLDTLHGTSTAEEVNVLTDKIDLLIRLIHDNNYMLITLISKMKNKNY